MARAASAFLRRINDLIHSVDVYPTSLKPVDFNDLDHDVTLGGTNCSQSINDHRPYFTLLACIRDARSSPSIPRSNYGIECEVYPVTLNGPNNRSSFSACRIGVDFIITVSSNRSTEALEVFCRRQYPDQ